ncbi:ATP-dependent RecD-like DNA helicase [Ferroacidibacillus organovorans]|uniref:ATP-dependent RecD2 DNA helicase n=1 Tax=Ferroacidibacillus organovorans TaxID=1765683 RepID=A0A101XQJ6_9BACL|nr:ATP-dependent RecD-like DNA helicase [Ferroacidibacillus organovorans]KUO95708.1 hypothetical protein ATW55_13235 [Ferroacidibacillus organovorans]
MATQRLRATAEKILAGGQRGFAALRLRLPNGDTLTAIGQFDEVPLGAECDWVGSFEFHPVHGRQFRVSSFTVVLPTSTLGVERFLASGAFRGIGPKTAKRIVDAFGVRTLDVLREDPQAIRKVPGISRAKAEELANVLAEKGEMSRLGAFLTGHGMGIHLADKLADVYGGGQAALQMLQSDPYQTIADVRGIGFRTSDQLASALGIDRLAPSRVTAALLHVLDASIENGHIYLPYSMWLEEAVALLGIEKEVVAAEAQRLMARASVVAEQHELPELCVYSARHYRLETQTAALLRALKQGRRLSDELLHADAFRDEPSDDDGKEGADATQSLSEEQLSVTRLVDDHPLVILTGGPGTGKTTAIRHVVSFFERLGAKVVLAAPTGKAAKRLAQSTDRPAQTIHRLLEMGKNAQGRFGFGRDRSHRMEGNLFIIDEASMIDAPLFYSVLEALPEQAHVLLVGDPEQLPAVGPGMILKDLIDSSQFPIVSLSFVFRQGLHSQIVRAAHDVRMGRIPQFKEEGARQECFFIEKDQAADAAELIVDLATRRLPRYVGCDARQGIQILSPMKRGYTGTDRLNEMVSKRLQTNDDTLRVGERTLRVGDRVMYTKNDYERELFNGDTGLIESVSRDSLVVRFTDDTLERRMEFTRNEAHALIQAFAISVHKSQGSEYSAVIVPVMREHAVMLFRQLLYTAMTRAKSLLVLVGTQSALELAVRQEQMNQRFTGLSWRLKDR